MKSKDVEKCNEIMKILLTHPSTVPYRYPADIKGYTLRIKRPMDLNTIFQNLNNGIYNKISQFKDDVELVWHNAKEFNEKGEYVELANYAKKIFEKEYHDRFKSINSRYEKFKKMEEKLDELLSNPPKSTALQGLSALSELKPKSKKSSSNLINEVYENIIKFTDPQSQREIFSILRLYDSKFGGSPIVKKNEDCDPKEVIDLNRFSGKSKDYLYALKEYIETHRDRIK